MMQNDKTKIVTALDVIEKVKQLPDPKMIWKGIPEGSKGLFTGVAKTGKTTIAENLAISISVGRKKFMGQDLDGVPRKVLFMNLEEKPMLWAKRQGKQIQRLSKDELELFKKNYFSMPEDFLDFLNTDEDWNRMKDYIVEVNPDVVIIDSLSHMVIGQIETSAVVQAFVQRFRKYLGKLNKTILVIHHNTKGNNQPLDMSNIAGSRFISQEFEYAYGFANVPGKDNENYMCMLYNKYVESENATGHVYKFEHDGWVAPVGVVNKFDLYKDKHVDYRTTSDAKNRIIKYFESQTSQTGQTNLVGTTKEESNKEYKLDDTTVTTASLVSEFVLNSTMSKDTLHRNLNLLVEEGKLTRLGKGQYCVKVSTS